MNRFWAGLLCMLAASWVSAQEGYGPYGAGRGRYDKPFYSNAYAGLSFGQLRYSEEGLDSVTPATAMVLVGAALTPNLAIEGRFGGGLGSAQTNGYGIEVRSLFAGYVKGSIPVASGFALYGLGGVANVNLQRDFGLVYANDTGLSYGLGMDFDLASNARLSLEWTHLATGDNLGYAYDVNQASIAMAWRF
ncbi:MAG TPA: outer membrane beta-barrel protein [Steroidobacteraceae bacterium]|nr:outer membrane beta-barrel protein [Steroidobacteraceae bacterium]